MPIYTFESFRERVRQKHGKWPEVGYDDGAGWTARLFEALADEVDEIRRSIAETYVILKNQIGVREHLVAPSPPIPAPSDRGATNIDLSEAFAAAARAGAYETILFQISEILRTERSNYMALRLIGPLMRAGMNREDVGHRCQDAMP